MFLEVNGFEIAAFVLYFCLVIGIGLFFFIRNKSNSEKDYFIGGRHMNGWVSALSAGASDMSAWVLMGLPGSIFLYGLGQVWISIGLFIGTVLAWVLVAPRLRRYAIVKDTITLPQFFQTRFNAKNNVLRITCAIIFVVGYLLYSASSIVACGTLFNTLIPAVSKPLAMCISAVIILVYTLLGGFNAVCWTDFFQGLLMLAALMFVPIVMVFVLNFGSGAVGNAIETANYYSLLSTGKFDWGSISNILTGIGWGLGYFGMPHILIRYMAIKSEGELKKSKIIGSTWTFLILTMATVLGLVAHEYLGDSLTAADKNLVFVTVVRNILGKGALALIAGILISAIVAASMSTADSQLLSSSSAFASDIFKTKIKKDASDKLVLMVGRVAVGVVTVLALGIALLVYFCNLGSIMELVSAAWSIFGAAFGPTVLLALFWKKFNYRGAVSAIITGFGVSLAWLAFFNAEYYGFKSIIVGTNLYEIVPGFIISMIVGIVVSLTTDEVPLDVKNDFDKVVNFNEADYEAKESVETI